MCLKRKGDGYNPEAIVKDAIEKAGYSTKTFFIAAQRQCCANFNPETAAGEFEVNNSAIPKPVVQFADWVHTHERKVVKDKINVLVHHPT